MRGPAMFPSGPVTIACPKCGSPANYVCRTLATGRTTDMHIARLSTWYNRGNR